MLLRWVATVGVLVATLTHEWAMAYAFLGLLMITVPGVAKETEQSTVNVKREEERDAPSRNGKQGPR